jgi:hypothetical protein
MIFLGLFYTLVLSAFLVSTAMTGCAPVTVQQTTLKNTYTDVRADVVTTGELSQMTEQGLDHRVGHFRPFSMTAKHFPILFSLLARLSQDPNIFHQILIDDTNPMLSSFAQYS